MSMRHIRAVQSGLLLPLVVGAWALQAVAANGFSERVSVVHCDVGLLERGREVRRTGANIAVADIFDAGTAPQPPCNC